MELLGYLDPGTGSFIVQALLGLGVGLGVVIRTYWHKIRVLFGGKNKSASNDLRKKSTQAQKTEK